MKLHQFSNLDHPRFAKFNDFGDTCSGTVVLEPEWVVDPLDPERVVLRIVVQDNDTGVYWQINVRSNLLVDVIFDALITAGADELVAGGRLEIEFVDMRGNAKLYRCVYEPPDRCGCVSPGQLSLFDEPEA